MSTFRFIAVLICVGAVAACGQLTGAKEKAAPPAQAEETAAPAADAPADGAGKPDAPAGKPDAPAAKPE